jgi:hypothetical protein
MRVAVVIPSHRRAPVGLPRWLSQGEVSRVVVIWNADGPPPPMPGATILRQPWQGHGPTRQAALAHVHEPFVLFTVDDALPLRPGVVSAMVEALVAGPFEAVVARQLPWAWSSQTTRRRLAAWTPWAPAPTAFPQADHVATLYRSDTLRENPLPAEPIGEDLAWSQGRRVGMAPAAVVLHAHRADPFEAYRRERALHALRRRLGLPPTVSHPAGLLAALPAALADAAWSGPREGLTRLTEALGQWRGGRPPG